MREFEETSKADGEAAEMRRQAQEAAERGRAAKPADGEKLKHRDEGQGESGLEEKIRGTRTT